MERTDMKDVLSRALLCDGKVSAIAVCSTAIYKTAAMIHGCAPCAAAALGRCLTASVLMGAGLKGKHDKLSLIVDGNGPAGKIICTVTTDGVIKGYIRNPQADLPLRYDGKLDIGGVVGRGQLTVTRDEGQPEPYVGVSELVSGEIAQDIASYYKISQQTPSAVLLGERMGNNAAAGGILITPMPGCDADTLTVLENKLRSLGGIGELVEKYESMEELLLDNFWDIGVMPLQTDAIAYHCDCSRERMEQALMSLGKGELAELAQQETTQMKCRFCNSAYTFSAQELLGLSGECNE
ncbi:MAG: Hsp33 family molecular chaperone HslO [Firmicutes bacterium]|nr:Hsp33 family molecular chaperone HslO [Bacillota bacterium]